MKKTIKHTIVALTAVSCIAGGSTALAAGGSGGQSLIVTRTTAQNIMPISAPIEGVVPISAPVGDGTSVTESVYEIAQQNELPPVLVHGTMGEAEGSRIPVMNVNEEGESTPSIILGISDDTLILNAVTGLPMKQSDLRENEALYAYAGPIMTMSMPPQSHAVLILAGIPADFAVPAFGEVDSVTFSEDGAATVKTNDDNTYTVTEDTKLTPYLTKNIVTVRNIQPGTKVLAWGTAADESTGGAGAVVPSKMMLFPYAYQGYAEVGLDGISMNGEAVQLEKGEMPYVENGKLMLPFRKFVEAAGYTIDWNAERSGIAVLSGEQELYAYTAGGTEVKRAGEEEPYMLLEAAVVHDGVSFMAADDLLRLNNVKLAR
ncbi:stalk domain-containing protein [Paenibacillus sp. HB172176]|uniref:stalk domain-containing protein n=1 Tax=Paenibacillus sp. HB172176 TaxID=2493690 RepID=UPI0014399DB9|nr:stalk domain-containing protein [Paenibacillus sp. HB172176]